MSGVMFTSGGGLSASYGCDAIFLALMKTTLPPRKKERGRVL
jgi:hypothetical protein